MTHLKNTSVFRCKRRTLQSLPPPPPRMLNKTITILFISTKAYSKEFTCLTALTAFMQIILKQILLFHRAFQFTECYTATSALSIQ